MKLRLYLLELIDYDHFDEQEKVDVEDRWIIGYFSNKKILDYAISLCEKRKSDREQIHITEKTIECGKNQKFVYVLFYEYTLICNGEYSDFYENFEPHSNYNKCIEEKQELLKNEKYQNNGERIFENSPDGFRVAKIKINHIDYINYH